MADMLNVDESTGVLEVGPGVGVLTKELCKSAPSYIRILGMNETGRAVLKEMKRKSELPIVVKTADFKADRIFDAEIRASEAAALCRQKGALPAGGEYRTSPVIIYNQQNTGEA